MSGRGAGPAGHPDHVGFLRGVNVGGKGTLNMAELRAGLTADGFRDVDTHINSGNVLFTSDDADRVALGEAMRASIQRRFGLDTAVAVFAAPGWSKVMADIPAWWGDDPLWRHNLLILIPPCEPAKVLEVVGELRPGIERLEPGPGVVYQSILRKEFSRSRGSRINRLPLYQELTVRGPGTAHRLLALLQGPR